MEQEERKLLFRSHAEVSKIEKFLMGDHFQQITIRTPEEIDKLRAAGKICAKILDEISPYVIPGVTLQELNDRIHDLIYKKYNAEADRLLSDGQTNIAFRIAACFGLNEVIANAPPSNEALKTGDLFGIDISIKKDGYCGDTRKSWLIGEESSPIAKSLFAVSYEALWLAISMVKPGARLDLIGKTVEAFVRKKGHYMLKYPIICAGHSLGKQHLDGWLVPLYDSPINKDRVLKEGMVFTIETFMSAGSEEAYLLKNEEGTVVTKDGSLACYWEHALAVTKDGCEILDLRENESPLWAQMMVSK